MPRSWPLFTVYHVAFSIINQDSESCFSFKCISLLIIRRLQSFWIFTNLASSNLAQKKYLQILHKLAYVHLLSEMRKKNHYVLSLYFGYKSNKHKNLMLCAFQNLELAKKEAALILRIFPFPASLDRSVFSCKLGSIQNLVKF